jgi:FdhD protein
VEERINVSRRHARGNPLITASTSPYPRKEKIPTVASKLTVKAQIIRACINDMNNRATGFKQTGALHGAAIYTADGALVAFAEDVSRHNTVDKVIGMAALRKVDFGSCFLAITGRVPSDLIFKAAKVGLPIFASVAAVLSSGVTAAKKANIALVGFVRGNRMNIYAGAERIII